MVETGGWFNPVEGSEKECDSRICDEEWLCDDGGWGDVGGDACRDNGDGVGLFTVSISIFAYSSSLCMKNYTIEL